MSAGNVSYFYTDLEGQLISVLETQMFGLDVPRQQKQSGTGPAGKAQDGFKDGLHLPPLFCRHTWFGPRPLLFPVGCWGKTISTFDLEREGTRGGWDSHGAPGEMMMVMKGGPGCLASRPFPRRRPRGSRKAEVLFKAFAELMLQTSQAKGEN